VTFPKEKIIFRAFFALLIHAIAYLSCIAMHEATIPLPIEDLTTEEITWLATKSANTGKSVSEVVRDLLTIKAAEAMEGRGE
jgi:hypothetical protein